jgi:hypothetical protein
MTRSADPRDRGVEAAAGEPVSGIDLGTALVAATVVRPAVLSVHLTRGAVDRARRLAGPAVEVVVLHPPLVPQGMHPGSVLARWSRRGREERAALRRRLDALLDATVPRVAGEVVSRLDLDALVTRLDLTALARTVIVEVDLPEIIRESTGALSSGAVREVRLRSISGDDTVGRAVDRLLLRRRRTDVPS